MPNIFDSLPEPLREVLRRENLTTPTEIQQQAIPLAVSGRSVLGVAKTGTGKTLAYVLPILVRLLASKAPFFALVLAPTQELASQINDIFKLFSGIGLKTALLRGNEPFSTQQVHLANDPHVLVGCPGRVLDHMANTRGIKWRRIRVLVLDECDKMLSTSLEGSMNEIVKRLSPERQTLLFSATFGERVRKLSEICKDGCEVLRLGQNSSMTADNLKQQLVVCPLTRKINYLVYLVRKYNSRCIIFAETRSAVEHIYLTLKSLKRSVSYLHGNTEAAVRSQEWTLFKRGAAEILVATLECGRGLDIEDLPLVFIYNVPATAEKYTHAVGRTARAGNGGKAIMLAAVEEQKKLHDLERTIGLKLPLEACDLDAIDAQNAEVYAAVSEAKTAAKKQRQAGQQE